jgi:hypothetical protein
VDDGPLPTDRPHFAKVAATYRFEWFGSKTNATDFNLFYPDRKRNAGYNTRSLRCRFGNDRIKARRPRSHGFTFSNGLELDS